jgi:hypothetical protein
MYNWLSKTLQRERERGREREREINKKPKKMKERKKKRKKLVIYFIRNKDISMKIDANHTKIQYCQGFLE